MRTTSWVLAGAFLYMCLFAAGCSSGTSLPKCTVTTDCDPGQVCNTDLGRCEKVSSCAEMDCADLHRECTEDIGEPKCGSCLEGYSEDANGLCQAQATCDPPPAPGSILQECQDAGRECVEQGGVAQCGDCLLAGQVLDQDTGICRDPQTCDDISCGPGEVCLQPAGQDAYCSTECRDEEGNPGIVNDQGQCVLCPKCDDYPNGEDGPYLGGLTGEGKCICETLEGYYWQVGEPIGVHPCDKDSDGWARYSAKLSIDHEDDVVSGRARCALRTVAQMVLHNEAGQTRLIPLDPPAQMYESDRNDDQELIQREIELTRPTIPLYPGDQEPQARELNTLTKLCVSELADYNDNGVEDVAEWHGMDPTLIRNETYRRFVDFTYFVQLHRGWFEPGGESDSYHIAEKSRKTNTGDGWRVSVVFGNQDDDYWRECARKRDSLYNDLQNNLQGMDFAYAWENTSEWWGMNHHSQFKCLVLKEDPEPNAPPNVVDPGNVAGRYRLNQCTAAGSVGPDPAWVPKNPSDPVMQCQAQETPPGEGVQWAAVEFEDYGWNSEQTDNYLRGCVNECSELAATCAACPKTRDTCPGMESALPGAACVGPALWFGELFCGCGLNFGGADCRQVCFGRDPREIRDEDDFDQELTHLFLQEEYTVTPRVGYWMCLEPVQTAYQDDSNPQFHSDSYTMRGQVPNEIRPIAQSLCQDDDGDGNCDPGGYQIR